MESLDMFDANLAFIQFEENNPENNKKRQSRDDSPGRRQKTDEEFLNEMQRESNKNQAPVFGFSENDLIIDRIDNILDPRDNIHQAITKPIRISTPESTDRIFRDINSQKKNLIRPHTSQSIDYPDLRPRRNTYNEVLDMVDVSLNLSLNTALQKKSAQKTYIKKRPMPKQYSNTYLSMVYNEQELRKKIYNQRQTLKRQSSLSARQRSMDNIELIDQKLMITAFQQIVGKLKIFHKKYQTFRQKLINQLLQRHAVTLGGYQEIHNESASLSYELLSLISQGITEPYANRVKIQLKKLDTPQKELGWLLLVQEAQHYFNQEFYQTIQTYDSLESLQELIEILEKSLNKYQEMVNAMVFEMKEGYQLYSQLQQMVDSIKKWLKTFFAFKQMKVIMVQFEKYSDLKKKVKSPKIHNNYIMVEYNLQNAIVNINLTTFYKMQTQNMITEMNQIKQRYYSYYVECKTNVAYKLANEIYECIKIMKKGIQKYQEMMKFELRKRQAKADLQQVAEQIQSLYKKIIVTRKKFNQDPQLEKLLAKFYQKAEIIEQILD